MTPPPAPATPRQLIANGTLIVNGVWAVPAYLHLDGCIESGPHVVESTAPARGGRKAEVAP